MKITPKKNISILEPYHIEDRDYPIILDANECAFDFDDNLKHKLLKEIGRIELNRYPDGNVTVLKKKIAEYLDVNENNICIGNGSDEVLQYIVQSFCSYGNKIVYPCPSFSMYKIIGLVAGAVPVPVNLLQVRNTFELDIDGILDKIKGSSLVIIAYPNNPTGNCFDRDKIKKIINNRNSIVIIDEAYSEYCGRTFLPFIKKHDNLIILRSFSKVFGLAGIRVGVAVANRDIIEVLEKIRLPYNISSVSQVIAGFALKNKDKILVNVKRTIEERDRLFKLLSDYNPDKVFPFKSDANFILFRVRNANKTCDYLKKRGILIRNISSNGLLKNCLRVSIGTKMENDIFIRELSRYEDRKN